MTEKIEKLRYLLTKRVQPWICQCFQPSTWTHQAITKKVTQGSYFVSCHSIFLLNVINRPSAAKGIKSVCRVGTWPQSLPVALQGLLERLCLLFHTTLNVPGYIHTPPAHYHAALQETTIKEIMLHQTPSKVTGLFTYSQVYLGT